MATLIFPAINQLALDYLKTARNRDENVVAAASIHDPQMESAFGELLLLPYVYDGAFREQILALLSSRRITQVYAPVASVYTFMETFLVAEKLPIQLIGTSPISQQVEAYRALFSKTEEAEKFISDCTHHDAAALSFPDIAAIFRQAGCIYGESSDEKIMAMMAIFATAPKGDVIEIGTLMGKSAFVLQYLAQHYQIGPVLSVDPLSPAASVQHDSPDLIRTKIDVWDYDILRQAVIINLLPTCGGSFNYLRMESEHAFAAYCTRKVITSPEFGDVSYSQRIAVIHIDGNHDFKHVHEDCELWLTRLVPDAWVILDDYLWSHGDGPQRVGNALLKERWADIDRAFVCGKALFIKFRSN